MLEAPEHSLCSSSSLSRRELCPASLAEESLIDSFDTKESSEGTRRHKYAERFLKFEITEEEIPEADRAIVMSAVEMLFEALGDEFLPDGTTANGGRYFIEKRVQCTSTAAWNRNDWGTIDVLVIYKSEKRAFIGDFKFGGAFVPHPRWNRQLQDYSCNVWDKLGHDWCIETSYFQPFARGMYNHQPWHFAPDDLHRISLELKRIRDNSYMPSAEYRVGPACQFCKASMTGTCWARGAFLCSVS